MFTVAINVIYEKILLVVDQLHFNDKKCKEQKTVLPVFQFFNWLIFELLFDFNAENVCHYSDHH